MILQHLRVKFPALVCAVNQRWRAGLWVVVLALGAAGLSVVWRQPVARAYSLKGHGKPAHSLADTPVGVLAGVSGALDPAFDGDGRVTTLVGNLESFAQGVTLQSDGKIVAVGADLRTANPSFDFEFAVARYNPDGSPDTAFDGDGKVTTAFSVNNDIAKAVAAQADGKIVVAGFTDSTSFDLARYQTNGALDTTFDGDGKVTTIFSNTQTEASAIAIQPNGRIIVAGFSNGDFALARYNPDGSLDATFDGDGKVTTAFGNGFDAANGIALQTDGKIVTAGAADNGANSDFALARYNSDGSLDTAFDGDGKVTTAFGNGFDAARGIILQADGKIVAAGAANNGANDDFALARYNSDGSLDPAFDGDGRVMIAFTGNDEGYAVALQASGKIVVAGSAGSAAGPLFAVAQCNPNGSLDTTFDNDGKVTTTFGNGDREAEAFAVVIQPDNKIVAAGYGAPGGAGNNFALARYLGDPAFGTLQFSAPAYSVNENVVSATVTVTRSNGSDSGVSVNYATANGTATAGSDYAATSGTLTWGDGDATAKTFTISILDDNVFEGNETVNLALSNPGGGAGLGTPVTAALTIVDNETCNCTVQFSAANFTAQEATGLATLTVTRAGNTAAVVSVDYATNDSAAFAECSLANGLANQRCDYTATSGTLSFAADETSKTFNIPLPDDTFVEGNETLQVSLLNASTGLTLGAPGTATLTISDDDTLAAGARTSLARLNGAQEVPVSNSAATGTGSVTLNEAETQITASLSFSGLGSAQTAAHIHGFAPVGTNAPVLFNLGTGTISNATFNVTPVQAAQLKAGLMYFNVHTANFPDGEIRGQILPNPLESARFFVRQQYLDFLSRDPVAIGDQAGYDYWTGQLTDVGSDLNALKLRRRDVSNAFFVEAEYQQTGVYAYRLYRAAYGNNQPFPNPNPDGGSPIVAAHVPSYHVFAADRARVIGGPQLTASQLALAIAFAGRPEFVARYAATQTGAQFVDALLANIQQSSGANLSSQQATLLTHFANGGRGLVLFHLANDYWNRCAGAAPCVPAGVGAAVDNRPFLDAEYNRAFVTTQYYGYLRRDADLPGLNFWLSVVNQFPLRDEAGQKGMVCAFITSGEYQQRFGAGLTRTNQSDCP